MFCVAPIGISACHRNIVFPAPFRLVTCAAAQDAPPIDWRTGSAHAEMRFASNGSLFRAASGRSDCVVRATSDRSDFDLDDADSGVVRASSSILEEFHGAPVVPRRVSATVVEADETPVSTPAGHPDFRQRPHSFRQVVPSRGTHVRKSLPPIIAVMDSGSARCFPTGLAETPSRRSGTPSHGSDSKAMPSPGEDAAPFGHFDPRPYGGVLHPESAAVLSYGSGVACAADERWGAEELTADDDEEAPHCDRGRGGDRRQHRHGDRDSPPVRDAVSRASRVASVRQGTARFPAPSLGVPPYKAQILPEGVSSGGRGSPVRLSTEPTALSGAARYRRPSPVSAGAVSRGAVVVAFAPAPLLPDSSAMQRFSSGTERNSACSSTSHSSSASNNEYGARHRSVAAELTVAAEVTGAAPVFLVPDAQVAWTTLLEQLRLAASRNEALAIVVRSQRAVADPSVDVPAWVLDAFRQTGVLPLRGCMWNDGYPCCYISSLLCSAFAVSYSLVFSCS